MNVANFASVNFVYSTNSFWSPVLNSCHAFLNEAIRFSESFSVSFLGSIADSAVLVRLRFSMSKLSSPSLMPQVCSQAVVQTVYNKQFCSPKTDGASTALSNKRLRAHDSFGFCRRLPWCTAEHIVSKIWKAMGKNTSLPRGLAILRNWRAATKVKFVTSTFTN